MLKFISKFCIVGAIAALFSYAIGLDGAAAADVTFGVQVAWIVLRLIPCKAWLAIGEAFAEMMDLHRQHRPVREDNMNLTPDEIQRYPPVPPLAGLRVWLQRLQRRPL
jgi:hypothetical protein